MIGDFRIALSVAAKARGIEVIWRPTNPDLPVRPDEFFTLRFPWLPDGGNRAHFFLEADRSTMSRDRFWQKLMAYCRWSATGGPTAALGIKSFRVLTVTRSDARRGNLVALAAGFGATTPMFWFTSVEAGATRRDCILSRIWTVHGLADRRSLIPRPPPL